MVEADGRSPRVREAPQQMQVFDVSSLTADYSAVVVAGWFCLMASVYFVFRCPAANAFLGVSLVGVGGAPLVAGNTYGRLSGFVAVLTVMRLLLQRRESTAVRFRGVARTPVSWFAAVCLVIAAKMLIETAAYGMNASRTAYLTSGLVSVLYPTVVVVLGLMRTGPEATARDLLIGMTAFPALMIAGYLPYAIAEGLVVAAWNGEARFTIGMGDTVSSARVLAYGAIGSLLFFSLPKRGGPGRILLVLAVAPTLLALALLTGNRQYPLGLAMFFLLWVRVLRTSGPLRSLAGVGALVCVVVVAYETFTRSELVVRNRYTVAEIQLEAREGRGSIWVEAYRAALEHPLMGTGFKNFGRAIDQVDRSGQVVEVRDTAHGVFQDVFAEHGLILGFAFLLGCIQLATRSWRGVWHATQSHAERALLVGLLALLVPLVFSSGFLSATPIAVLLVMTIAQDPQYAAASDEASGVAVRTWRGALPRSARTRLAPAAPVRTARYPTATWKRSEGPRSKASGERPRYDR
jgi:hypothetical protein